MNAYVITIGDEILIGQIMNSNAAYIGEKLSSIGIPVDIMSVVGDDEEKILKEFHRAVSLADVVLVTGGLGPTHDDVTRSVVCTFFATDLVANDEVRANIEKLMKRRNYPWTKAAEDQALVPRTATPIPNRHGTAPGYWFEQDGKYFGVMPGVPYEMKSMMEDFVLLRLSKLTHGVVIRHRTLKTTGIPESFLAEKIGTIEDITRGTARIAFLPSPRGVRLRITAQAKTADAADAILNDVELRIRKKADKYIYAVGEIELEVTLSELLKEKNRTLAIAESCTGGLIADRLTNIPGSSQFLRADIVAYSNDAKVTFLNVPQDLISEHGAVSKEVAEAMARGVRETALADIGVAVTGIAGPGGGSPEKPVGLVWVGYADKEGTLSLRFNFGDERLRVKERASQAAMELVRRKLLGLDISEQLTTD
jgi:nicotinamide-nucleotide amidase